MTTRSEDASNLAEADFLAELISQFDKDIDLRKTLDNKANTMITVISGITILLIAIGTFLISRIAEKNIVYDISIGILAWGVVLATVSIWYFIQSYSLRSYKYAVGHEYFFDEEGNYKKELVQTMRELPKKQFNDLLYKGYLESIKTSATLNEDKAIGISKGQRFLIYTLLTTAILVGFVLLWTSVGVITLH
jgi:hypothetical protein